MLIPKHRQRIQQYLNFLETKKYTLVETLPIEVAETQKIYRTIPQDVQWTSIEIPFQYGKPWTTYWFRTQYRVTENVGHSRKDIFSVYAPVNELTSDTEEDDWDFLEDAFIGIKSFSEYASENSESKESEQEETQLLNKDKDQ